MSIKSNESAHEIARELFIRDDVDSLKTLREERWLSNDAWFEFLNTAQLPDGDEDLDMLQKAPFALRVSDSISKPLLVMFMCGARRCCDYILDEIDHETLPNIRQSSGNILHAMVCGLEAKLRSKEEFLSLLDLLCARLSLQEMRKLSKDVGFYGLRPAELASWFGEFELSEKLLTIHLFEIHSEIRGAYRHTIYDLGDYDVHDENSRYFVSPFIIMLFTNSFPRVTKLKESGIFRKGAVFYSWARSIEQQNRFVQRFVCSSMILNMLITIFLSNKYSRKRLADSCNYAFHEQVNEVESYFELITIALGNLFAVMSISVVIVLLEIKYKQLKIGCNKLNGNYSEVNIFIFFFLVPSALTISCTIYWVVIMTNTRNYCDPKKMSELPFVLAGILLGVTIYTIYVAQFNRIFGRFVSNFLQMFGAFCAFFLLYFVLIVVSAKCMETWYKNQILYQNMSSPQTDENYNFFKNFYESIYSAFRMTLNIVDMNRPYFDLSFNKILHIAIVLILPFMFFNYIIGVVSSHLSVRIETEKETLLILDSTSTIIISVICRPFRRLWTKCTGRSARLRLHVVHPLTNS